MATSDPAGGAGGNGTAPAALPEPARRRVVELAAACLGLLEPGEVPPPLRHVARFEPRRRGRLGATRIAVTLEADEEFRERVADGLRTGEPELCAAVESGTPPAAADPVDIAAAAYLLRPEGWTDLVAGAAGAAERSRQRHRDEAAVSRLHEQVDTVREEGRRAADRLSSRLEEARAEVRTLRTRIHQERTRTRAAERAAQAADEALVTARRGQEVAEQSAARAEAELRRLRARLEELAGADKRAARAERTEEAVRLAVLVDALVEAAQGVRRELALPIVTNRPADAVAARHGSRPEGDTPVLRDDPAVLDRLLAAPRAHLVVDGYNVTKTGWPELTLKAQRARLVAGLGRLAAVARTEVTCVFDGADLGGRVAAPSTRGVRVLFSPPGTTADELIAELLAAEPSGRRVVVVSSDQEVAAGARRTGAEPVPAATLVERLTRA